MSALIESWDTTRVFAELFIALDDDDPRCDEYKKILKNTPAWVHFSSAPTNSMVASLNNVATRIASQGRTVVGFMGDDHRPRTYAWDAAVHAAVSAGQIVYCDDLLQGRNLPTQVAMPAAWIRALNQMAPSVLHHLYVDNYWKTLGERLDRLTFLDRIVIEHMHPVAGKSEWDEGYVRVNAGNVYQRDAATFERYLNENMDHDVALIREVIDGV